MLLQINDRVKAMGDQAQGQLAEEFARIDAIAQENTARVLAAFQKHRVADGYFAGTTGYGYDDLGRDKLDEIYADLFGTEAALVRIQFVNGTHAIACALFGALKSGDVLLSAVGAPYDTLLGVVGAVDKGPGSLKDYGVEYRQVELLDNKPDLDGMARAAADPRVKAVLIQRSKGYSTRASLSVEEIGEMCRVIKEATPSAAILVDNCYGEFVETVEPTHVGADLVVGSLIKNPGGGLAPTGGYIAGRRDLVEGAAMRLTVPGIGGECGCTLGQNRLLYQGLFLAPHTVAQAVKTAVFAAKGCPCVTLVSVTLMLPALSSSASSAFAGIAGSAVTAIASDNPSPTHRFHKCFPVSCFITILLIILYLLRIWDLSSFCHSNNKMIIQKKGKYFNYFY